MSLFVVVLKADEEDEREEANDKDESAQGLRVKRSLEALDMYLMSS